MRQLPFLFFPLALALSACSQRLDATGTSLPATTTPQIETSQPEQTSSEVSEIDPLRYFDLGDPICTGFTPENAEGPYYKPGTPERTSLLEEGMPGERIILVGYVLDSNCAPLPGAWLDFWQADDQGEYDNTGFTLRGHQFTDEQGRYSLETVIPGLYDSRPIRHIHVKVRSQEGTLLTSQLYFPDQPVEGLTVQLERRGDSLLARFDFRLGE